MNKPLHKPFILFITACLVFVLYSLGMYLSIQKFTIHSIVEGVIVTAIIVVLTHFFIEEDN